MSKHIATIPLTDIERVAIVFGGGRAMSQVKGDADFIMNGGFYNMTTGKPVYHLKANGTVYNNPSKSRYGITWDIGADIRMDMVPDNGGSNYISGVELLSPACKQGDALSYSAELGGFRGRTALALSGDKLILYCCGDGTSDALTPEALRNKLVALGAESALMLDGGGSSQCDFQGEKIYSSRRVNNYIAVWLTEEARKGTTMSKRVVLDPGHGVETAGKCSPDGTYFEHEFALDMSKRIKHILTGYGVEVFLTREDEHDITNFARAELANKWAPDLVVSVHSNAAGSGEDWMEPRGFGIYTSVAGDDAGRNIAARAILQRAEEAGLQLWGGGLHHERWTVLAKTNAPAVLIEHLFHDNREDVALLKDSAFRDKLAEVDAKGILDYLGIPWEDKPATAAQGAVCPHCGGVLKIEKG